MTDATALVLAAGDGRSGYAERDGVGGARRSTRRRRPPRRPRRRRGPAAPRRSSPGGYRAVLEPYALAELLE